MVAYPLRLPPETLRARKMNFCPATSVPNLVLTMTAVRSVLSPAGTFAIATTLKSPLKFTPGLSGGELSMTMSTAPTSGLSNSMSRVAAAPDVRTACGVAVATPLGGAA